MKDLDQYNVEDFVTDEHFIRWVLKNNEDDELRWKQWLLDHPGKQEVVATARAVLLSLKINEKPVQERRAEEQIQQILKKAQQRRSVGIVGSFTRWKYAAIFVGLIITASLIYLLIRANNPGDNDLPEKSNGIAEVMNSGITEKTVQLADGSTVRLAPGSVIRYSTQMATQSMRDVYLSGEAFFEVAKNPNKPFRVFSQELVTKVLGTSFTVKAKKNDSKISVTVITGKVSVYDKANTETPKEKSHKNLTGVVLTPNQELIYLRDDQRFEKNLVDLPVLINPDAIKNNFQYENVPVEEVLVQLKKAFGINILFDKEVLRSCRITADLSDESIYNKLDLICRAMDATYEIVDGQISITAKPCI
jgi:ferric-dicitrate binding protein FerR (iron transport regulator)